MGGYLSRARPRPEPAPARAPGALEKPQALAPPRPAGGFSSALPTRSRALSLSPARKLPCEHPVASPGRRRRRRRLIVVHRQRSPVRKARCLLLGVFPRASSRKRTTPALPFSSARMPCPSAILSLASARGRLTLCLALEPSVLTQCTSRTGLFSVPKAKQFRLRALEDSSPDRAKEEKDLASLGDSGKGFTIQGKGNAVPERREDPRRRSDGNESSQSAFRRLVVNGVLSSFLPRPGPLKRDFCYQSSVRSLMTKSQSCFLSSCSKRNAITSSYSSTQGFPLQPRRNGTGPAGRPSPGSSHFLVPAKKATEEVHQASTSASVVPQRKSQHEKVTDAQSSHQQNLKGCSNPSDLSRPPKRKILLLSCRRKDPVILPPPPQLAYQVTAEEIDLEKRAAIQWINKVLKDDRAKTPSN
ncbi:PREDICTED: nuclear envelope pore membrane protein POM 121-like [Chinchilla lanigera]|uniref:nuclear envelope pore membrane protein POM 121-like n=1 Tax=Chinchilla lanigera TaxID=34839 RepID=UPI000695C8EF|nr:PREDICTED: nuclear envelope pore membrane protein POM 121-like [Chinchilla lanigera]